jgi:hypothetical protein
MEAAALFVFLDKEERLFPEANHPGQAYENETRCLIEENTENAAKRTSSL